VSAYVIITEIVPAFMTPLKVCFVVDHKEYIFLFLFGISHDVAVGAVASQA